ncbi:UDP-N-acetylmuramoyl-tripeptide--D-alanyl-D-alanine ligase [Nocardioides dongxiaopingii]|uniref:UDP-N-acetylmuramoyl-tripeptide--D-alanyl-D- alanine ligase n=1 Tax=Nocardioides TaxID=1839 RepID=UPI0010C76966|nr:MULTISPECIES: UDP-N-acetylmuramoyl-tripeptide--D-alanyl-D-alanine ligase [Nocardioides]QCW51175.2 UDP-N-acetylmuramoyl-tripeptide--D-alanyl-D-alanine ligase [Nocardioides sp. S-1144]
MITLPLREVAAVVRGELHGADVLVTGAAYLDSRETVPGGLFVAIAGEHVDGHEYAGGAHAVLGSRPTDAPTVVVDDVTVALGRLAALTVGTLEVPVLALTGSQGKTGTKDYLAHVLGDRAVATRANNNNELGVPLTVLRADESTEFLVLEMGARGIGHLAYLAEVAPPTIAAVLNVGTAHVGEFGGVEAIAAAKGELVEALEPTGVAVLNADDPRVAAMASRTRAAVLTFGQDADVRWRDVTFDGRGRARFELGHDGEWVPVALRQTGAHQVANAAAAAAMALAAGRRLEDVADRLGSAEAASRWRMELTERADGLLVLNDAYNANPASMRAALDAVRALGRDRRAAGGRTIAVLGEMKELGPEHDRGHREVGEAAAGVDVVVVVGEAAGAIAEAARAVGVPEVVLTAGRDDAAAWVRKNAVADDVVLVKASRAAALEHIASDLLAGSTPQNGGDTPR